MARKLGSEAMAHLLLLWASDLGYNRGGISGAVAVVSSESLPIAPALRRHQVASSQTFSELLEDAFHRCADMDASLAERQAAFADAVRTLSPHFADAVDRLVERLQKAQAGASAPKPGELMPSFTLPDETGRLVSLETILAAGPAALTFHRGHWCPYCRINTQALARAHEKVHAEGGQIVAILPDRQHFASQLKSQAGADFPVLIDVDNGYALSLNLAIWVGAEMERMIAEAGWDVPTYQGNRSWLLPIPATFVVGTDGRVKARFVDPDYRKRMAIEDMIGAIINTA